MIARREFISLLGGAAATWPLAARAQQADRCGAIGVLSGLVESDSGKASARSWRSAGARKLGWSEGRTSSIDIRWGAGDVAFRRIYAAELMARRRTSS